MTYRAVLFDLGNTLVGYYHLAEFPPILARCIRRACDALALPTSDDALRELEQRARDLNQERDDHVVLPLGSRLEALFDRSFSASEHALLADAFLEPIFGRAEPYPGALRVLASLRERGLYTALVSNTPWGSPAAAWRAEVERHGLSPLLTACVFCVDVGYRKPHPAPFRRALELLGVEPADALFVGDDPNWDVAGARVAGLTPVLLGHHSVAGVARIERLEQLLPLLETPRLLGVGVT